VHALTRYFSTTRLCTDPFSGVFGEPWIPACTHIYLVEAGILLSVIVRFDEVFKHVSDGFFFMYMHAAAR
jgi:hypothetical protein